MARAVASSVQTAAREWLLGDSRDFRIVCNLAGLDYEAVRDCARRLARRYWEVPYRTTALQRQLVLDDDLSTQPIE
jgi:hypothetical protein